MQKASTRLETRLIRVLLVYPNTIDVALANLGFQKVYGILNQIENVTCDRLALPKNWKADIKNLKSEDLRSMDENLLPRDFDMIAFSISFEPDYLNAMLQLKYFQIPLERKRRDASHPLILAGGSAIFINPEPLADIMDVFFIGEGEGLAAPFFDLYATRDWEDSRDLLQEASALPGLYVPKFYDARYESGIQTGLVPQGNIAERIERHWVANEAELLTHSEAHDGISTFKNMALMEVTRGCIWACRFCTAGFIYRPPRLPDLNATYDSLSRVLDEQGQGTKTIGLVGPSVTDHPDMLPLARRLVEDGKKLSFSSLRMETLTEELVGLMVKSGQKTLTVAVDAPSERMRDVVNKAATDDFIVEKCKFLTVQGVLHLKIYSIIGLPEETEEDIDQFIRLVERVQKVYTEACSQRGKAGKLTIGLSPLIPKPGTPFQWHPMERKEVLKKRFMRIRKAIGRLPHIKCSFGSPNEAYLQTYLSRGDRRLSKFFQIYLKNGHDAKGALRDTHPHPDGFVYRQYGQHDFLPWDIVDHGYRNDFLWQEYQRGLSAGRTPVCDTATCHVCGIC